MRRRIAYTLGGRRTRVMGSMGYIEGDTNEMSVYDFRTGERTVFETQALDVDQYSGSGHGGGDWRLMANWVEVVAKQDASLLSSSLDASVERSWPSRRSEAGWAGRWKGCGFRGREESAWLM